LRNCSEDGDSVFFQNAGVFLQVHMAWQPRRTASLSSEPWEPQILNTSIINACQSILSAYVYNNI
jgi:hypothetical protein